MFCLRWAAKYPWLIFFTVLPALLVPLDHAVQPYFLKKIIDCVSILSGHEVMEKVLPYAIGYLLCSVFWELSWRLHSYFSNYKYNPQLRRDIFLDTVRGLFGKSYRFYQNEMSGKLTKRAMDLSDYPITMLFQILNRGVLRTLSLIGSMVALFLCQKIFGLIMVAWCIGIGIVVYVFLPKIIKASEEFSEQGSVINGEINDVFTNITSVKFFANWKAEDAILKRSANLGLVKERKMERLYTLLFSGASIGFFALQGLLLYFLLKLKVLNSITPGDFALVMAINFTVIQNIWDSTFDLMEFIKHVGKTQQALKSLYAEVEVLDKPNAKDLVVRSGEIVFDKVCFRYDKDLPETFSNFSCTIKPGEKVGLVGQSGAGKTTFVNLLLRTYDVQSGFISIDGQDISVVKQDSLHRAIATIPQDPSLFHRTLYENIAYGDPESTTEQVYEAARRAEAHEFILATEDGYNSMVGERGIKISGGQRQRIAIARAFLKNAPILILDEATSALDSVTEREIQSSLWRLMQGKTCIVVAHRLSTLVDMDRILVFEKGTIVQDGSHAELSKQEGAYKTLWDTQVNGFIL